MSHSPVEFFRKQSKALLSAVERGDEKSIERVNAVLHEGIAIFGLMKAQHVVAAEAGFGSWNKLLVAPETSLRLAISRARPSIQPAADKDLAERVAPFKERMSRRTRRDRLSEGSRSRLRNLLEDGRLTVAQTNFEFRACQWSILALVDATAEPAGESRDERQRVRKLVQDSTGDLLTVEQTAQAFRACHGSILRLLEAYESPSAQAASSGSFTAWISRHSGKDSQLGDLADDWLRDIADFEPTERDSLLSHLRFRGAGSEVLQVAHRAWKSYAAWRQKR